LLSPESESNRITCEAFHSREVVNWRKISIALKTPLCGSKREIACLRQLRLDALARSLGGLFGFSVNDLKIVIAG
jgi:hypothetical protein